MGVKVERRFTIESGSPMRHHSMSSQRMKQGSDGATNMENQLTGGRKVRMAERRRYRRQEEIKEKINDAKLARLARLEETIGYLKRCDWRNDDAVEYARSATRRFNGIGSVGGENVTVDNLVLKKYNGSDL